MIDLLPDFGNLLFTLAAFVVALSVIVAVHEYGHYIVGRWTGIRADVFSIGFGPVLLHRMDRHGTRWQIAAIPLGGYVKFRGDANAASAPDAAAVSGLTPDERRMTMQGAPLWARAATVAAGPAFNFVLSIGIFAALMMVSGVARDPLTVSRITDLPFQPMELREGDVIVAIEGQAAPKVADLGTFISELPDSDYLTYTVRRDGSETDVTAPHPRTTYVLGVEPRSAAGDIDMRPGDVVTAVDGIDVVRFDALRDLAGASNGRALQLTVVRDGESLAFALRPRQTDILLPDGGFETRWLIGLSGGIFFEPALRTPGPVEALSAGIERTVFVATSSLSALSHVVRGAISTCNLSGPVGIARVSGEAASMGPAAFLWMIAVLSTAVGLLNLFPIPILDGGHLVFHAWEAISGRPPGDRALQVLMTAGLAVMLAFMAFALGNDLFC